MLLGRLDWRDLAKSSCMNQNIMPFITSGNLNYLFIQFSTPHEMIKTFVGYYVAICFNPHELFSLNFFCVLNGQSFVFIIALEGILALFSLFNLSNKRRNSLHTSKSCANDETLACSMLVCELASISHRYRVISFLHRVRHNDGKFSMLVQIIPINYKCLFFSLYTAASMLWLQQKSRTDVWCMHYALKD